MRAAAWVASLALAVLAQGALTGEEGGAVEGLPPVAALGEGRHAAWAMKMVRRFVVEEVGRECRVGSSELGEGPQGGASNREGRVRISEADLVPRSVRISGVVVDRVNRLLGEGAMAKISSHIEQSASDATQVSRSAEDAASGFSKDLLATISRLVTAEVAKVCLVYSHKATKAYYQTKAGKAVLQQDVRRKVRQMVGRNFKAKYDDAKHVRTKQGQDEVRQWTLSNDDL